MKLTIEVNGAAREVDASPWKRLLDVLREDLRLTGTKEGCGEGECGACTVLLDGEPVNSCLVATGQCDGRRVTTVEGLARGELLHAVQRQLVACGGAQCGICTPGIAVCAAHLVDRGLVPGLAGPASDEAEAAARAQVRELLAGNICRCTGYQLIVEAVIAAAREVASAAPEGAPGGTPGGTP
jgi:carbon-monoxide dehydrogenase small subunit